MTRVVADAILYNIGMYIRPVRKKRSNGAVVEHWALVESYRTARGPRQRVVSYLGDLTADVRMGVECAASERQDYQPSLCESTIPQKVDIDLRSLRVERTTSFGGVWLGKMLLERLGLDSFFAAHLPQGREDIPWALMSQVLILGRLLDPSSELRLAEHIYERTAFAEVFGVPVTKINDDRLYRTLDALLPHKAALAQHLCTKGTELFGLTYDLLLYDVTSTYFEGTAAENPSAKHGHSRDHRPDCVQMCIALVVDRSGFPLGYEVFPGNRHDSTTVKTIITLVEKTYGRAERIWVMDRGMVSEENLSFLRKSERKYIIGTPKAMLKTFKSDLLAGGWDTVHDGLEVKTCSAPDGSEDRFILCRSQARQQKEQAMHQRFEARIEDGLKKMKASCEKRVWPVGTIERRVGKLLGANTRASGLFDVTVSTRDDGKGSQISWKHKSEWRDWAVMSEGCYLLRSNIDDLPPTDIWTAYIGLTQAEAAFRIQKSDLQLRPIWHQRLDRAKAHLLVCFLAFVLWKTLGRICSEAGLGDEPRRVLDEVAQIMLVDVAVDTTNGITIRKRCVAQPTKQQAILLNHLKLQLPAHFGISNMQTNVVTQINEKKEDLSVKGNHICW